MSGSDTRKRAYAAQEADEQTGADLCDPEVIALLEARYADLGPPPRDTVGRVQWGNELLALLAWETVAAPKYRAQSERRQIGDLIAKLGLTAVKSLYEERLKKLEELVHKGKRKPTAANDPTRAGSGTEPYTPPKKDKP